MVRSQDMFPVYITHNHIEWYCSAVWVTARFLLTCSTEHTSSRLTDQPAPRTSSVAKHNLSSLAVWLSGNYKHILRNQLVGRGNSNSYYLVSVRTAIWNYIEGWSWEHWAKIISRCLCSVKFGIYVEFRKQFSWLGAILPYYTFDICRDWKIGSIFFSPVITGAITIFMQIIFMQVLDSQN